MRHVVGGWVVATLAVSSIQLGRFGSEVLTGNTNVVVQANMSWGQRGVCPPTKQCLGAGHGQQRNLKPCSWRIDDI